MGNSRYTVALHALVLLEDPDGGWVSSDHIATSVNTNAVVIRRTLKQLEAAGLVVSQKGARGGYRLRRPGRQISLWEVYQSVREDGPFGLHPRKPNARCPVGGCIQTHLRDLYDETEASMQRVLAHKSVGALRRQITAR